MFEFAQAMSYVCSLVFFWTGTVYFLESIAKLKNERLAQEKFQELMKSKEFIKEYLETVKGVEKGD